MRATNAWWKGLVAGAVGTVTLNTVTYLDMAVRGRPASTTPETTMAKLEQLSGISLSGNGDDSDKAANRRSGLGALMGIASGLGTGLAYGMLRPRARNVPMVTAAIVAGIGVNAGTVVPMAALGVSDPMTWPASSWVTDIVPHLAYGLVTAALFDALSPAHRPGACR